MPEIEKQHVDFVFEVKSLYCTGSYRQQQQRLDRMSFAPPLIHIWTKPMAYPPFLPLHEAGRFELLKSSVLLGDRH